MICLIVSVVKYFNFMIYAQFILPIGETDMKSAVTLEKQLEISHREVIQLFLLTRTVA
jgi:hypothetical protein